MEIRLLLVIFTALQIFTCSSHAALSQPATELLIGFKSTPDPSVSYFQPLLTDSTGNYSLGFLRVNSNRLSLSILHVPSSEPLWSASTNRLARWANPTHLSFNGSLILSDTRSGVFWSSDTLGDQVRLSNNSNLVIQNSVGDTILWESFKFPSDTLVENQNFTRDMALVSSNGLYSMRLGSDFFGLYANYENPVHGPGQIYLKHRALEAKADVIEGVPVQLVLMTDGYLGMFQNSSIPVDVQSFNSFQQNVSGIRRVKLESDGNLKGYYWTGSSWILEYQAISEQCELPSSCGSYALCKQGKGCSCLDNQTVHDSNGCGPPKNHYSGDLCGPYENRFKILRKTGVELPFKELMGYIKMESISQCENTCERNCTCWGAVYSNSSGFCYMLNFPIQTLVAVGDQSKVGYFKVRDGVVKKRVNTWLGLSLGLLFGAILVFGVILGVGWYKLRSRGVKKYYEEDEGVVGVGPYKDLGTASFRSIEMCEKR